MAQTGPPASGDPDLVQPAADRQPVAPGPATFGLGPTLAYGAGNFGAGLVFAFTNAALPLYLATYPLPNAAIGLLSQDRPPLAGLLQLAVGALSDRTRTPLGRRRPYILLGVPVAAAGLLALAVHPPVWLVVTLLVLLTSFLAIGYGPYLALLVDLVPSERRARVGSVLNVGNMAGQLLMLYLASQLWVPQERLVFWLVGGGLVLGFGLTVLGVREPPTVARPGAHQAEVGAGARPSGPARQGVAAYVRGVLRYREACKYLLATLFFWFGTGAIIPFLTRFGVEELGTDEPTAFRLLMIPLAATAVASLPAGWLGDRYGKRRILMVGLCLMGTSVLIGSQVRTVEQAAAALLVTGVANALCSVLLFPLLADMIPRRRAGEFTGLGSAVWELAQPVGAVLGGLAADVTGSLRSTLGVAGLVVLVSAAVLLAVHPPAQAPE
ncbi:MAG TPA: MFS transporter [Chloroflexota bacterium]|nr:MFS transporter [Chloroflexota bacterium]